MHRFEKIILLGSKTTAYKCAEVLARKASNVHFYENLVEENIIPSIYKNNPKITWHIYNKKKWSEALIQEKKETLLISAVNQFILPKEILGKSNITFINMHFALLPKYKGRNCAGWSLYNGEKYTGTTWHYMTEGVDEGQLLWQQKIPISDVDTSFSIFRKQCSIGVKLLNDNIESFLNDEIIGISQDNTDEIHFHYSKERPNKGILDLNWTGEKISCFLRSMDYGPLQEFGVPLVVLNNSKFQVTDYIIEQNNTTGSTKIIIDADNDLIVNKLGYSFKIKIKEGIYDGKTTESIK